MIGKRFVNNDMLLLSTVGRISGKSHTVPLLYLCDGEEYAVVASWGGRDDHPQWYENLQIEPKATIQIRERRIPVRAATADSERRTLLWPRVLAAYEGYGTYQSRTERQIPVVILTPR